MVRPPQILLDPFLNALTYLIYLILSLINMIIYFDDKTSVD